MNSLSDKQIKAYQTQLLKLQQTLLLRADELDESSAVVELDQSRQGRLSRMDALQGQEMSKAMQLRRQQQLKEINMALKRIDQGEFGYCQQCDELIAPQRLDINPALRLCIKCAD